ncbi:hypothetical protein K474DRAFT_778657 [Panus rudis PR-1116 ss-1]|nr:hypothetical protein K474DRAFT_778657 [Panus rudis PR-1116 ss-1]
MSKSADTKPKVADGSRPLIPENVLDVPSQRLYYLSLGLLCQAIKVFDFINYLFLGDPSQSGSYTRKWVFFDFLYCGALSLLRIPRLNYAKSVVALQIVSLCLLDAFLFGGLTLNLGIGGSWKVSPDGAELVSTGSTFSLANIPVIGSLFASSTAKDAHLLGQHTVRMSPISTAQLNPYAQTFCIASPGQTILIPLLLNNTNPSNVRYTLTPLGYGADTTEQKLKSGHVAKVEKVDLYPKDLKAIEQARLESLQVAKVASLTKRNVEDYDEYDDDEEEEPVHSHHGYSLQKTQSMQHIRLSRPGVLRVDRVLDASGIDARLVFPTEVTIAPCPRAEFIDDGVMIPGSELRCASPTLASGGGEELELQISIYGVPPLSLKWHKDVNGRKEPFMVEGIEGETHVHAHSQDEGRRVANAGLRAPQQLTIPLTVPLDALGTHSYVLEAVIDALGNVVTISNSDTKHGHLDSKAVRSATVLRRPKVSFRHCGPGNPASLLIGSEAPLTIAARDVDSQDAPWDITVNYHPLESEDGAKKDKRYKPWTQNFSTQGDRTELTLRASAPGEYTISGIKGAHCEGDVLSPETCKVVEKALPTAEIEWKKIHECSGDIGVSASLVLHGTPPFQVFYSMKRDDEPAREVAKTFTTSRGDITIQPERSGHYTFTFLRLSDANYKKVPLKGPSIDQVVHPPASADFIGASSTGGRNKRRINSCSGSTVDVNVELRGTGPWNLDVQVVGPKGSEIVRFDNIKTARKTLKVPIPPAIDRDGGAFEIDLVTVEDAYGCKRALSVPGITVNVRRVKPTAKFYGTVERRQITILEGEDAKLPLRLTGDGPWRLKYRTVEQPDRIHIATLASPNDELKVTDKGTYEIIEISDSQCPGTVITDSSTYVVNWVPRPSARLSTEVQSTYEPFNGSHILPPICEGLPDHVDLDLTGRPPFQIMYNIARDTDNGGTKILDQPTFSSIQPRTRFQLHTAEAGRIYYEVKQIGDASYPLAKNKHAIIPRSARLLFEQQVLMRPSARFKNNHRISYCLNDAFTPHDYSAADGVVVLEGTPPFQLELTIKNLAASEIHHQTIQLDENVWKLNIPSYTFRSIGPHLVTIESIQDASHCAQATPDPLFRSVWVDVAETAAIVPFDRREHYCIGDITQFQLEGTPPWTIGYRVNGKSHVQEVKTSPFAVVQEQPGEFAITSIAHQHKMCKTAVTDLKYAVHPLPSAQVGHGKRIIQDIHEGDQAEIVFTLIGEPPFTFTYQRTELTTKKGVQGKVLETHTVSGVTTKEYSIFSALEGTWTVTFISDRYCRYPPTQDGAIEKSR